MPEGPSIVILKELLLPFKGKKILLAEGNAKIEFDKLQGIKVIDFKSWGKHFLICFKGSYIRIHLLMFGTYRINEEKEGVVPRLSFTFKNGTVNFYTCSVKYIENDVEQDYDWEADVMSESWNALKAEKKISLLKNEKVCDLLLNQELFSGVGNIIKNEVLFRTAIHPESLAGKLPSKKIKELISEARGYSFDFYYWKKAFELKKNWLVYKQKKCSKCKATLTKEYLGKGKRLTCFCENCQKLYA